MYMYVLNKDLIIRVSVHACMYYVHILAKTFNSEKCERVCVCDYWPLTISWQNFALSDIAPYFEWQLSLWVPHRTLMSVHVTHSKPGQELHAVIF